MIATMVFNMGRDPRKVGALGTDALNPYSGRDTRRPARVATKDDFNRLRKLCGKG
jgi:hypothetical protein